MNIEYEVTPAIITAKNIKDIYDIIKLFRISIEDFEEDLRLLEKHILRLGKIYKYRCNPEFKC